VFLKLNEFETGRIVRVNVSKVLFYKTIRTRVKTSNTGQDDQTEATGIRFENEPILLVVTESVDQIDSMMRESYHYIK
jgi:hypothetical protein